MSFISAYKLYWHLLDANDIHKRLHCIIEYKATVARCCPALLRHAIDAWSIQDNDVLDLQNFLDCYSHSKVVVLDIGTFVGVSAFFWASQQKVSEVFSNDYNPTIDELKEWGLIAHDSSNIVGNFKLLDVVEAALEAFPYEKQKIRLRPGRLGDPEAPMPRPSDEAPLLAFVDGDHREEGVRADLQAIFERAPYAVALLHDCRGPHGPSVQRGITYFIKGTSQHYHFHLFERMITGVPPPNLGVVYPNLVAPEMEQCLLEMRQLSREEGRMC